MADTAPATTGALKIGCSPYDHVRPLAEGLIKVRGSAVQFESARPVTKLFERMIKDRAFDVSEMGMTYYLRTLDLPDPQLIALPVFVARFFRHSGVFINTNKGIGTPADLNGRRIGEFALYGHDSGVWPKGIMADEHGFEPNSCSWVVGSVSFPLPHVDFIPQPYPANVDVTWAPQGADLGAMLEAGEIDALISGYPPRSFSAGSLNITRIFPDHEVTEREYFRRTGIFPIMHTVVVPRALAASDPGLVTDLYNAFVDAKAVVSREYSFGLLGDSIPMVPWMHEHLDKNEALMGEDPWPYGISANRKSLDTFLRYHHEQGLSKRLMTCEEIFVPELLET